MNKISAVIITLNEERNIGRCITSLQPVADEVVVIDSLSTDQTQAIARELGARVVEQPFLGHIEQKNFAIEQATHDIILSLDADESLSPELTKSILQVKQRFDANGYSMNRLTNYCGQWIKHSGWYPDTKLRLFKKGEGQWTGVNPHDKYELNKGLKEVHLKGDLFHYSFYTIEEHINQVIKFSDISARAKFEKGIRSNWFKIAIKPIARFVKSFILKAGFLDGYYGWIIARKSAWATYLKYTKLLKIQRES